MYSSENNALGETGCNRWQSLNCTPVSVDISVKIRFLSMCGRDNWATIVPLKNVLCISSGDMVWKTSPE